MSDDPQEFDELQKLLKLKRFEQPPPGYFNSFSTRVINRLEKDAEASRKWGEAKWMWRLLSILETNPIAAGLFGMSVCGLLISGIAYSQYQTPANYSANADIAVNVADNSGSPLQSVTRTASVDSFAPSVAVLDTNGASAFDSIRLPSAQRVDFQLNQ